ncbi:hypothetical protein GPECTOR_61g848 [Gonium pectorale]|uniref:E3 ubiquitin-protein ligase listerin n=1 Tax=Gonium pectorale TaxID=33097 RepID=A0A150G5T1_GONPE|nr:hypothetical protein GPECTOR_61g848 [Gonium pectorale]|eukprot:KXZ44895.1 hypothetical protein GPECTOR_61g848 [Gonium pectorale]
MAGAPCQCLNAFLHEMLPPVSFPPPPQNLRSLIPSRSTADLLTALPPWIYMYRRLILDPSRAVRSDAAATLSVLLASLGKAIAPHLKALMGPWWLAMYDPYGDAAAASRAAFAASFPAGRRQLDVVLYCRTELMSYLRDQLAATPQQLGDARKDSPEELEERHERVQAAGLAALAALIEQLTAPPPAAPAAAAAPADEAATAAAAAAAAPPAGADDLLAAVRERSPGLLHDCAAEAAACVLGALGEKEPGNHGAMWEAVLTYGKFCPDGWRHVNLRKMLLPRLYSLLRHGCFGSAPASLPALLPLLPLLPGGTLGPAPDVLAAVLDAVWAGMQDPACGSRPAKAACLTAYRECLAWGLASSGRLSATPDAAASSGADGGGGGDAPGYCRALLRATLAQHVLPAALRPGPGGEAAAGLVSELVQALAAAAAAVSGGGGAAVALPCVSEAVQQYVSGELGRLVVAEAGSGGGGEAGALAAACDGTTELLTRLKAGAAPAGSEVAAEVAAAATSGLMAAGAGGLPPAASQLLATLLREYGKGLSPATMLAAAAAAATAAVAGPGGAAGGPSEGAAPATPATPADGDAGGLGQRTGSAGAGSFNLDSLVASYNSGPLQGPSAEATADLLVAFCHTHDDSPALWDQVLAGLLSPGPQRALAGGASAQQLQRLLLLLQRCAAAAAKEPLGGPGAADDACWGSDCLDALAVGLARGLAQQGEGEGERGGSQRRSAAGAVLSAALGGNAAGLVMLRPAAAAAALAALAAHLDAAGSLTATGSNSDEEEAEQGEESGEGSGGAALAAAAAAAAVSALRGPLCAARSGLWRLLPDAASAAVAGGAGAGGGGGGGAGWGGPPLRPRAWAAHAAALLRAAPGGAGQRSAALDELLGARREWRCWGRYATGDAAATAAAAEEEEGPRPLPSVEYLARLTEAAGAEVVLAGGQQAQQQRGEQGGAGGRVWALLELLCAHHAATAAAAAAADDGTSGGGEEEEEEEEDGSESEDGDEEEDGGERRRSGAGAGSSGAAALGPSWRRAVGRAADALLRHLLSEAALEAGGRGAGPSGDGAYGALLRSLLDDLAEGCRGGSAVAEAASCSSSAAASALDLEAQLPPAQAAFLDALVHVLSRLDRASPPVAYRMLLGGSLLGAVTLADAVGSGGAAAAPSSSAGEIELPEYDGDDVAYLTAGGVRPEMAALLQPPSTASTAAGGRAAAAAATCSGSDTRVYLTAWALLLAHALELDPGSRGLAVLRQLLREAGHLVTGLLGQLLPQLGLQKQGRAQGPGGARGARGGGGAAAGTPPTPASAAATAAADADGWQLSEVLREVGLPAGRHAGRATCRALYRAVLRALPATARGWFNDLRDRGLAAAVEAYTAAVEGPALLAAEMASVQALSRRAAADSEGKFTVRASSVSREVVAVMEVEDGAVLELLVRLPACLPLRAPEVECRRKVGVDETRLRKWLLSIATFLRHQNGSVADAIGLWKRNVDSEFAGVEACLICYSVISSVNAQLPRLVCRTCNVRFHPACLYKWFKSAGKSQCPHCQALW